MNKKIFDWILKKLSHVTHKRFLYVPERKSGLFAAVKSAYGFWYCGDISDQSDIAYGVASKGTVEAYDTEVVMRVLKNLDPSFVLYDIGSNTGWYTMISFAASTTSKVYSFEPILEHIQCQKETVYINRREDQVKIFELALSNHNGEEIIRLGGSGTSLEKDFLEVDFGTRGVKVQTLNSVIKEHNLPDPHFIKIDVEGHEYKVLQGAKNSLKSSLPILFVEIAYSLKKIGGHFINSEFDATFTLLNSLGYEPFIAKDKKLQKYNPAHKEDGVYMFLFLHNQKHLSNKTFTEKLGLEF